MKRPPILFLTTAILFALDIAPALSAQPSNITIQYVSPEKFADFRIYGRNAQWSASYFASQINDYLGPRLNRRFPGAKLTLRFTDIDLAGSDRNPSSGGRNVRVNRGIVAPARISFVFLLQDSSGRTLASGSTRITDTSNPSSLAARQRSGSEPLYYEKQMLEKWLKSVKTR
jgi:Protein of unknown function (DUF3016)